MRIPRAFGRSALPLVVILLAATGSATAQDGYFFKQPVGTFNVRIGVGGPVAQDDLFDFFTDQLTLDRSDFQGIALGMDVAIRAAPRLDFVIGIAHDVTSNESEFADWVDQDDRPIEQTTRLWRTPITLSAKVYMTPRGRAVSKYAWVPSASFTPYLLAGGGVMFYDLTQRGDFVDFETLDVFTREFQSGGGGPTFHGGAGGEWWLSRSVGISFEGRYSWARADLGRDFEDFGKIDLSGFQLTTGIALRY